MSPEVEAAIIKVAGKWTLEIAKQYHPSKKVDETKQFLTDVFKWSYGTIYSIISKD